MRLGIFGGSFDPVHLGHLKLAVCCQCQAELDQIWFTPTAVQPLKQHGPRASNKDRETMLRLAIADHPQWRLCLQEIGRGGLSFTIDTLRAIALQWPGADRFLLMGADTLRQLPSWKSPQEVCQLATPLVVRRAGEREPDYSILTPWLVSQRIEEIGHLQIEMPAMPISSSQIRQQIAQSSSIQELVPTAVAGYIAEHGLYRES
jgi:nicotinate-nucleotide adenylyltransferase